MAWKLHTLPLTLVNIKRLFAFTDLHSLFAIYSSFSLRQHNECLIKYKHIKHKNIKSQEDIWSEGVPLMESWSVRADDTSKNESEKERRQVGMKK